jgi:tRNA(Ile)-lysidine synthase
LNEQFTNFMLEDFINFIQKENLFKSDQKILIAVSGGNDSIILSKLFSLAKFNFGIAHVNFSLRGEESLADEVFVKKFAKTLKVPYHTICFDTNAFAEKEKLSTQVAARILRYTWFEEIRATNQYDFIATAHHQLDSAETMLINLTRGTGLAGFHGIPIKNGHIIRPLSFANQDLIYDFVVEQKLTWREDSSNATTKYQRNFIRHEIMPKFQELNLQFEQTLADTSEKIRNIEQWISAELNEFKVSRVSNDADGNIYIPIDAGFSVEKWTVIAQQYLQEYHFSFGVINQIIAHPADKVGKLFESPSHMLNIDRGQWVISPKDHAEFKPILIQEEDEIVAFGLSNLHIFIEENDESFVPPNSPNIACLDADSLEFPLEIRKYQEGDWFCPLGMNSKKLISDFLTDKKVPLTIKKNTYILLSKGSVVWVMGHRIDNRNKVSDKTETVMILEIRPR